MTAPQTYGELIRITISDPDPAFERNPREGSAQPKWLRHRFPINRGLTMLDVVKKETASRNPLMQHMMSKAARS